jgi:hypothetical protein
MAMNTYLIYNRYFGLINENEFKIQIAEFSHDFNQTADELVLLSFRKNDLMMLKENTTKTAGQLAELKKALKTKIADHSEKLSSLINESEELDWESEEWEEQEKEIEKKIELLFAAQDYAGLLGLCDDEYADDLAECFSVASESARLRRGISMDELASEDNDDPKQTIFLLKNYGDEDIMTEDVEIYMNLNAVDYSGCAQDIVGPGESCMLTIPYECGFTDRLFLHYGGDRIVERWC